MEQTVMALRPGMHWVKGQAMKIKVWMLPLPFLAGLFVVPQLVLLAGVMISDYLLSVGRE
jgi:hypothetical protein